MILYFENEIFMMKHLYKYKSTFFLSRASCFMNIFQVPISRLMQFRWGIFIISDFYIIWNTHEKCISKRSKKNYFCSAEKMLLFWNIIVMKLFHVFFILFNVELMGNSCYDKWDDRIYLSLFKNTTKIRVWDKIF